MDEKDLLIQTQRREIASLREVMLLKDRLLDGYEKVTKMAIIEMGHIADKMSKELEEMHEYVQREISGEN